VRKIFAIRAALLTGGIVVALALTPQVAEAGITRN
jgi:hypothetical protein